MNITDPNEEYFKDGLWGWNATRWHKLPLVFGYTTHYLEAIDDDTAAAGDNTLAGSTVPAGELWIATNVNAANEDTNIDALTFQIALGAAQYHIACCLTPTKKDGENLQGFWPIPPGYHIEAFFEGCVLNDDIHFHVIGYKMLITA